MGIRTERDDIQTTRRSPRMRRSLIAHAGAMEQQEAGSRMGPGRPPRVARRGRDEDEQKVLGDNVERGHEDDDEGVDEESFSDNDDYESSSSGGDSDDDDDETSDVNSDEGSTSFSLSDDDDDDDNEEDEQSRVSLQQQQQQQQQQEPPRRLGFSVVAQSTRVAIEWLTRIDETDWASWGYMDLRIRVRPPTQPAIVQQEPPPLLVGAAAAVNNDDDEDDDDDDNDNDPVDPLERSEGFRRLVPLLRQPSNGLVVGALRLIDFDFGNSDLYRPIDVERLFREVIRQSHPLLHKLSFGNCVLPATYLKILATPPLVAAPSSSWRLQDLDLESCTIDKEGISHLATMVAHTDCRLRRLAVYNDLDSDDCRQICDAVCHNRHLRRLGLRVQQVRDGTLGRVAESPRSPLQWLGIGGAFTEEGLASLTQQLRTNTHMVEVSLTVNADCDLSSFRRQFKELHRTYNYTLRMSLTDCARGHDIYGGPNRRIKTAVRRLEAIDYRINPTSLWPVAFARLNSFPILQYRLLRRGNVDALCEVVRRSRPRRSSSGPKRNLPTDGHGDSAKRQRSGGVDSHVS